MADRHKEDPTRRQDAGVLYDPTQVTPHDAAIVAARAEGCTCLPAVTILGVQAMLQHDDVCALLRRREVN